MNNKSRELVFISHATPEDNVFTLWLANRLKLCGYQVWSDVTELFGGEKWWNDISEAIENFTCKFILVITSTSLLKPGVQKEIEYALAAEKMSNLQNFIIPLIIDDSPFFPQPYGLSERNIISFHNKWAQGFSRLVERMRRDQVPIKESIDSLGAAFEQRLNPAISVAYEKDVVISNLFSLEKFPEDLNFFRVPVNPAQLSKRLTGFSYPWFEFGGMLASFATDKEIGACLSPWETVASAPSLSISCVINRMPRNHMTFERGEVFKKMNHIITTAWENELTKRGLHRYTLSSGRQAFFFPEGKDSIGLIKFPDVHGEVSKRQIVGYSQKNKVFWSFAVEAKPLFGIQPKICMIPHIVFCEDGKNPIADKARMQRLRRTFCKMWWNDRWRDMLLAFFYKLSEGESSLSLQVSGQSAIKLSSRPILLDSPVTLIGDQAVEDTLVSDILVEMDEFEEEETDRDGLE